MLANQPKNDTLYIKGFNIVVENRAFTYRQVAQNVGQKSCLMPAHYGYLQNNPKVGVFVGAFPENDTVYLINQKAQGGYFDKHIAMFGFLSEQQAVDTYQKCFEYGYIGLMSVIPCTIEQLKWWLINGDKSRPVTKERLPYAGLERLDSVLWGGEDKADLASHSGQVAKLLYQIRQSDSFNHALEPLSYHDLTQELGNQGFVYENYDALVIEYNKLERKTKQMLMAMQGAADIVKPVGVAVSKPLNKGGVSNVVAWFEMDDGQAVGVFFHNPDKTPKKIDPTDEMISYKWVLNKKDITIVVAPENGKDLVIRTVAKRIMKLVDANHNLFLKANSDKAELNLKEQNLGQLVIEKQAELDALNKAIEGLEAQKAEKEANKAPTAEELTKQGYNGVISELKKLGWADDAVTGGVSKSFIGASEKGTVNPDGVLTVAVTSKDGNMMAIVGDAIVRNSVVIIPQYGLTAQTEGSYRKEAEKINKAVNFYIDDVRPFIRGELLQDVFVVKKGGVYNSDLEMNNLNHSIKVFLPRGFEKDLKENMTVKATISREYKHDWRLKSVDEIIDDPLKQQREIQEAEYQKSVGYNQLKFIKDNADSLLYEMDAKKTDSITTIEGFGQKTTVTRQQVMDVIKERIPKPQPEPEPTQEQAQEKASRAEVEGMRTVDENEDELKRIASLYSAEWGWPLGNKRSLEFASAVLAKDAYALEFMANGFNDKSKKVFSEVTGVSLPKQQVATWKAIRDWAGVSDEQENYRVAVRDVAYEVKVFMRENNVSQEMADKNKALIASKIAEGFDNVEKIGNSYWFTNNAGQGINLSEKPQKGYLGLSKSRALVEAMIAESKAKKQLDSTANQSIDSEQKNTGIDLTAQERASNWRTNLANARAVAKSLGIETKGKKLSRLLREIDIFDENEVKKELLAEFKALASRLVLPKGYVFDLSDAEKAIDDITRWVSPIIKQKGAFDFNKISIELRAVTSINEYEGGVYISDYVFFYTEDKNAKKDMDSLNYPNDGNINASEPKTPKATVEKMEQFLINAVFPEIEYLKVLNSTDVDVSKLSEIGIAEITDIGNENLYFEKDGKYYVSKVGNTENYALGEWDFTKYPDGVVSQATEPKQPESEPLMKNQASGFIDDPKQKLGDEGKFNVPVNSSIVFESDKTGIYGEKVRVTKREFENAVTFDVELFEKDTNRWIEQKSYTDKDKAMIDAKGWEQGFNNSDRDYLQSIIEGKDTGLEPKAITAKIRTIISTAKDGNDTDMLSLADQAAKAYAAQVKAKAAAKLAEVQ